MDAFEQQESQANILIEESRIYLYCCDLINPFTFAIPSLPFLFLKGCFCHFSFYDKPSERRICILPYSESLLSKLQDLKSPCLAEVTSSVLFEFLPEEVESVERDGTTLLIWNFAIASEDVIAVCPQAPPPENLQVAPLLEVESIDCNCSHFPCTTANILLRDDEDNTSAQYSSDENHDEDEDEDADIPSQGLGQGQNSDIDSDTDEGVLHTLALSVLGQLTSEIIKTI